MLHRGAAKKVTIYLNEDTRYHQGPLYEAILTFLLHRGVAGATASRPLAGFGPHHEMHTSKVEVQAQHMPLRIEFIDTAERVEDLLPTLYEMVSDGMIELQDTTIVKSARSDQPSPEPAAHQQRKQIAGKLLRIYLGEADRTADGDPLYDAIVKKLRMLEIAGATVYRGILGYGAKGHTHRAGFFHISKDLPVMISVIDTPEKINAAAEAAEAMLEDGLIVISDVDAIRVQKSL